MTDCNSASNERLLDCCEPGSRIPKSSRGWAFPGPSPGSQIVSQHRGLRNLIAYYKLGLWGDL